jgi:hypothetical protein
VKALDLIPPQKKSPRNPNCFAVVGIGPMNHLLGSLYRQILYLLHTEKSKLEIENGSVSVLVGVGGGGGVVQTTAAKVWFLTYSFSMHSMHSHPPSEYRLLYRERFAK